MTQPDTRTSGLDTASLRQSLSAAAADFGYAKLCSWAMENGRYLLDEIDRLSQSTRDAEARVEGLEKALHGLVEAASPYLNSDPDGDDLTNAIIAAEAVLPARALTNDQAQPKENDA